MSTRGVSNPDILTTTKAASIVPIPKGRPDITKLMKQYGCGPIQFSGTDNALYERHLIFDNVVDVTAADVRMSFEAIAHADDLAHFRSPVDARVKAGRYSTHIEPTGIAVAEARSGERPT